MSWGMPRDPLSLDIMMVEYVNHAWHEGESRRYVGDTISGLTNFLPDLKGQLRASWRLFSA